MNNLHTIRDYIRYAFSRFNEAELFYGHGTDNAWDEAVHLVLASLYLPWDTDSSMYDSRVTTKEAVVLQQRIEDRVTKHVPVPYMVNRAWFCGLEFYVDERVLIPRSPIAELIQGRFQPWMKAEPESVLDLCTGSGCIGLSIADQFQNCSVDLADISSEALEVAKINTRQLGLSERTRIVQSDLFDQLDANHQYDLIVSNPPYVDARDLASMPEEYQREPKLGLAAGEDGLDIVKRILRNASKFLRENGLLVVELGNSWGALEQHYDDFPFTWVEFENGGHGVFVMTADELESRDWN